MGSVIDRIQVFCQKKQLPMRQLEASLGAGNGTIGKAIQRGSGISSRWLEKLFVVYPDLDVVWMMTGKGKMLNGQIKTELKLPKRGRPKGA